MKQELFYKLYDAAKAFSESCREEYDETEDGKGGQFYDWKLKDKLDKILKEIGGDK